MSVKAKVEAIIYATEEPVTLEQLAVVATDEVLAELRAQSEDARLALNEVISDGPGVPVEGEELEEDAAFDDILRGRRAMRLDMHRGRCASAEPESPASREGQEGRGQGRSQAHQIALA